MICDILSSAENLDHCVEVHKVVYIVLSLCVDVKGQIHIVSYC